MGHQAGIKGELQGVVRLPGALALVRGLQIRQPVVHRQDVQGPLNGQVQAGIQGEPFFHEGGLDGRGQGVPVELGKPDRGIETPGQELVFCPKLIFGNEHPFFFDQFNVMIPGRILEVAHGQVFFGVQLLFVVKLGGFVSGGAPAGGNPGRDDFAPEVAALKLVGAAQEHAEHRLGYHFHMVSPRINEKVISVEVRTANSVSWFLGPPLHHSSIAIYKWQPMVHPGRGHFGAAGFQQHSQPGHTRHYLFSGQRGPIGRTHGNLERRNRIRNQVVPKPPLLTDVSVLSLHFPIAPGRPPMYYGALVKFFIVPIIRNYNWDVKEKDSQFGNIYRCC